MLFPKIIVLLLLLMISQVFVTKTWSTLLTVVENEILHWPDTILQNLYFQYFMKNKG